MYIGRDIQSKLVNRFFLLKKQLAGLDWVLNPNIQPVTNVDNFPILRFIITPSVVVTGTGQKLLYTVPPGKKWTFYGANAYCDTGSFLLSQFNIIGLENIGIAVKTFTPASSISYFPVDIAFPVASGWTIYSYVQAFTTAGTLICKAFVREEDDV